MSLLSPAPPRDVQWVEDGLGRTQPAWNTQPSLSLLESIARDHLSIPADTPCSIPLFAQGAFNRLYVVHTRERECLIRVALPVQPRLKTLSEVATIEFVRPHASELVPRVLAYDTDTHPGGLGFEWMMMEKLPGGVLKERWRDMNWDAKLALVKTVVGVLAKLHDHPLSRIGNIYPAAADAPMAGGTASPASPHVIGPIVSMMFFWDDHFDQDVPRGPFRSSHDWLASCLQFVLNDAAKVISQPITAPDPGEEEDSDEEDAIEEAHKTKALAERLLRLLPRIFPAAAPDAPPERTILFHDDLSFHNVLVDSSGKLTGLVDWECVSTLPLWRACTLPSFLIGPHRAERPDPETYGREDEDGDEHKKKDEDGRGDESENGDEDKDEDRRSRPDVTYFEHLLEWEQTQLRAIFLDEMERVQPEWVSAHRAGVLRNDFYTAMLYCGDELSRREVRLWVDRVEAMADEALQSGEPEAGYVSLNDAFLNPFSYVDGVRVA